MQTNSADLKSRAMLARLNISQWTGRKMDKSATEDIHARNGAAGDSGSYNKRLVARAALARVQSVVSEARAYHYEKSLPWRDDGVRLLPSALFFDYTQKMRSLQSSFDSAVAAFIVDYPAAVAEAKASLGGLYDSGDYPPATEMGVKFSFGTEFDPLPAANDFRVRLGDEVEKEIQEGIESRVMASVQAGMQDVWRRLHDSVSKLSDRLHESGNQFDQNARNRQGMVRHLVDLCSLLPLLNVTGDPDLEASRQEVEAKLAKIDMGQLKGNPKAREKAAGDAAKIVADMGAIMGQKGGA